jgi:hypothetical protein
MQSVADNPLLERSAIPKKRGLDRDAIAHLIGIEHCSA